MTVIILIIILAVLIFIHEWGHFLMAQLTGTRVEEFALGFPPTLLKKKIGEVTYKLNIIPFGGYVRITGEDLSESEEVKDDPRAMFNKPKWKQVVILLGGILFNLLLAWILISFAFMIGAPAAYSQTEGRGNFSGNRLVITSVLDNSPADETGITAGSVINSAQSDGDTLEQFTPDAFISFTKKHSNEQLTLTLTTPDGEKTFTLTPKSGVSDSSPDQPMIGIGIERVGTWKLPVHAAVWQGIKTTGQLTSRTVVAFGTLIGNAFQGTADVTKLTGPVGLANVVDNARSFGFSNLLMLTALISINLAILNIIPFPALDGGRVLFVGIEAIKGSPVKPIVAQYVNTIGFVLLILLMVFITYHDIVGLVTS